MEYGMERWYMVAPQRFSVRKYDGEPSEEDLDALKEIAKSFSRNGVRIELGVDEKIFTPIFLWYGKVKGASHYAAFIARNDTDPRMVGYLGEAFILECCAMGLGTCWLGASYKKKLARDRTMLSRHERISCITPIGVPGEQYAGRPRRSLDKLTGLTQDELIGLPEWQQRALECARIAPSAVNAQPWSFEVKDDRIIVRCISNNLGYGMLDCGIAMLHIELGASHCDVSGEWKLQDRDAVFIPKL